MSKTNKQKIKAIAGLTLLAGGLSLVCPRASAESNFEVVVPDKPMLEIELDQDNIRLEMDPTLTKPDFKAKTLTITSSTNNPTGYTVYMSTENTSLVRTEPLANGETPEIRSLEIRSNNQSLYDYDELDFTVNSWGYRADSLGHINWKPIPEANYQLYTDFHDGAIVGKESKVSFAAKVDANQPAGSYTGTINFSIVSNSPVATSFNSAMAAANKTKVTVNGEDYYKMQDMNAEICSNVTVDYPGKLVDIRDNKIYEVLKGRDGNCWMVQNLDHNIVTTENFYTPENTDISRNWTPIRATISSDNISEDGLVTGWVEDIHTPYSLDAGNWTWNTSYNSWYYGGGCRYDQETNSITGCTAFPTAIHGFGADSHFVNEILPLNYGSYNKQVGNYYNWSAAHAQNESFALTGYGSAGDIYSSNNGIYINSSICPANWRLPGYRIDNENIKLDDFQNLIRLYDADDDGTGNKTDKNMIFDPLNFVRGGVLMSSEAFDDDATNTHYAAGSRLIGLGDTGYYLIGEARYKYSGDLYLDNATPLHLYFHSMAGGKTRDLFTEAQESNNENWGATAAGWGYSIRCMAR